MVYCNTLEQVKNYHNKLKAMSKEDLVIEHLKHDYSKKAIDLWINKETRNQLPEKVLSDMKTSYRNINDIPKPGLIAQLMDWNCARKALKLYYI